MASARVLVVDDEPIVSEVVQRYLVREGFEVSVARDGQAALERARQQAPDLVVLDLMLPKLDGLEVCRVLRAESNVAIIMLTAKGEEADRILGLGLGADDYLVKPFSPGELVARVKAVLRRTSAPTLPLEGEALRFGEGPGGERPAAHLRPLLPRGEVARPQFRWSRPGPGDCTRHRRSPRRLPLGRESAPGRRPVQLHAAEGRAGEG